MISANAAIKITTNSCESIELLKPKRIQVDEWVKDSQGNNWHMTGWVEVSWSFSDGIQISSYDIWMTGPIKVHFTGRVSRKDLGNGIIRNTISGTLSDENNEIIQLDNNTKDIIYILNESIIKNNPQN